MRTLFTSVFLLTVFSLLFLVSCQKDLTENPISTDYVVISTTQSNCVPIIAGQNINAGTICYEDVDTDNNGIDDVLKVIYTTTDGWELTEAHFQIADGLSGIPTTKNGNPIPGQFAYNSGTISGTTYTFEIPFAAINIVCPGGPYNKTYAAHCVVRKLINGSWQTQTGWGQGTRFVTQGNWGMFNYFTLYCDTPPPPPPLPVPTSETAWGLGTSATCFIGNFSESPYLLTSNRWGWSNGPYAPGTYTLELWGAAGQCLTSNGKLVGSVTIDYNGSSATVTYTSLPGYTIEQTHLYVGSYPVCYRTQQNDYTVSPGQFPNKDESVPITTTYTINGLSGNIYVLAHAVVKGVY